MQGLEGFKWCFHRIINLSKLQSQQVNTSQAEDPTLSSHTQRMSSWRRKCQGTDALLKTPPEPGICPGSWFHQEERLTVVTRCQQTQEEQLQVCAANGSMKQIDKTDPVALGLLLINITSAWKTVSSWVTEDWRHHPSAPSPLWLCSVWGASCECGLPVTWVRRGWCPHVTPRPLRVSRGATSVAFSARE